MTRLAVLVLSLVALTSTQAHAKLIRPLLPPAAPISDAQRATAVASYERAARAYENLQLGLALTEADHAYRALPNASTALIRATILGEMGSHEAAFAALLQAADLQPTHDERILIQAALARHSAAASPAFGWLSVRTEPSGAMVSLDGEAFVAPRTVGLSVGAHALRIELAGFLPAERTIDVLAGAGEAVDVTLEAPAKSAPVSSVPVSIVAPLKSTNARPNALGWALVGAGCAGAAGAVALLVSSRRRFHVHEEYATGTRGADLDESERSSRADEAFTQARRRSGAGYGLVAIAAISAGLGSWRLLRHRHEIAAGAVLLDDGVIVTVQGGL